MTCQPPNWRECRPSELDEAAVAKCDKLGLHPLRDPVGDDHHTDIPLSNEDKELGAALAWFLGTLFADVDGEFSRYWHHERTSVDEWSRVARALRIHGLRIADHKDLGVSGKSLDQIRFFARSAMHAFDYQSAENARADVIGDMEELLKYIAESNGRESNG